MNADPAQRIIAVIPARGGSKGIPRKNARLLCGKPLVAYSIESARKTPGIDRVMVSTDDEEIAEIAKAYGAEVPFLRPSHLAGDQAEIGHALSHLRNLLYETGYRYGAQVTLYPTHPFRSRDMMMQLTQKLREGFTHVYAGKAVAASSLNFVLAQKQGIVPIRDTGRVNGAIHYFRNYGTFIGRNFCSMGEQRTYFYRLTNPVELVDIDTPEDFILAEEIIQTGLFGEF